MANLEVSIMCFGSKITRIFLGSCIKKVTRKISDESGVAVQLYFADDSSILFSVTNNEYDGIANTPSKDVVEANRLLIDLYDSIGQDLLKNNKTVYLDLSKAFVTCQPVFTEGSFREKPLPLSVRKFPMKPVSKRIK